MNDVEFLMTESIYTIKTTLYELIERVRYISNTELGVQRGDL